MPYSYPEIKSFKGLYLQANSFAVPDGALEQADNVVLQNEGVLTKIRGAYQYYNPATDTVNQLATYQSKLHAICTDKVKSFVDAGSSPNETGTATTLTGETISITSPKISRTVESSGNLYFSADQGTMKVENTTIQKAGIPPSLDLRGMFLAANGGIIGDSQVSWRVVFGRTDYYSNLLLGSPGDILILSNNKVTGVAWTRSGGGPYVITVVAPAGHNLITGMSVNITNSTAAGLNGSQTLTTYGATSFAFSVIADPGASGTLDFSASRTARLSFSVPSEIADGLGYFYQVYRSSQSGSMNVSPLTDWKLIGQEDITAADIAAKFIVFDDNIDDLFLGAELYTNPNSREGEAQANERPPYSADLCLFKNHQIYANCISRHILELDIVSTSAVYFVEGDFLEVKLGAVTRRYVARNGVANDLVTAAGVTGTGTITISYPSHGLKSNDIIYISNISGTLTAGEYTISNILANSFDISAPGLTATALDFQGVRDSSNYYIFQLVPPGTSVSVGLRETAEGLIKAVNRDSSSLIYGRYISTGTGIPGKMSFQAKGFGNSFSMRASSSAVGNCFTPVLPSSFSTGTQVTSTNDNSPHMLLISKIGEPEAVPLVNAFPIGSKNKSILRIKALRDSVLIIKEDGVFRLDGDSVNNFTSTIVDNTVICVAPNTVDTINNTVAMLSNQGVCLCSSNSVRIVSREIEDPIRPILGSSYVSAQSIGLAYESARFYILTTIKPNSTVADVAYIFNVLSEGWTTASIYKMTAGCIGPSDVMYFINQSGKLIKERKKQTRIDYCGQNYVPTISAVDADLMAATINVSVLPEKGDVIVKDDTFNRISSVTSLGASNYRVVFFKASNLAPAASVILYKKYDAKIKTSPFHAGAVGRSKQYAQCLLGLRDNSISSMEMSFQNDAIGGSELIDWSSYLVSSSGAGWGYQPWGFFPWGNTDSINSSFETTAAPTIRIYVPIFASRCKYIQLYLNHYNSGEALNIQSLTYAVRGYGERVSR